jgi:Domain of unknown function (DUF3387)/Calcineurin-like phosphoesterase superfamily domain
MLIGVISDTHGRLDPAVEELFAGVERIFHAGDVGAEAILARLRAIAPLTAVRGNCDDAPWGLALPCVASEVLEGVRVVVVHDRVMLDVYASPELREAKNRGDALGLTEDEVAFYDALETNDSAVAVLGDATLKKIAQELVDTVRRNATIDWNLRESARAKMRVMVKRLLRKYGYPPDKQEPATQLVLAQAEVVCEEWAA